MATQKTTPPKKVKRKSFNIVILERLAETPHLSFTPDDLHPRYSKEYSLEFLQEQLNALVEDGLVKEWEQSKYDLEPDENDVFQPVPTGEGEKVYRISAEGIKFIESIRQQQISNRLARNANRLNARLVRLTRIASIVAILSVALNFATIPILLKANRIQEHYLEEANNIQTQELKEANQIQEKIYRVTVPDTVRIFTPMPPKKKLK